MTALELARAVEDAEAAATRAYVLTQRQLDPASGADWQWISDGLAAYTGPDSPVGKVIGLGLRSPVSTGHIARATEFYHSRGTDAIADVCALADSTMMKSLVAHGYSVDMELAVFVAATEPGLKHLAGASFVSADPDRLESWVYAVSAGFSATDHPSPADREIASVIARTPGTRCILALVDGEPAAGAALHVNTDPACLHSMSTRVRFRGRSLHGGLIRECQRIAAAAGCKPITAQTVPESTSFRNFRRSKFAVAYNRSIALLRR